MGKQWSETSNHFWLDTYFTNDELIMIWNFMFFQSYKVLLSSLPWSFSVSVFFAELLLAFLVLDFSGLLQILLLQLSILFPSLNEAVLFVGSKTFHTNLVCTTFFNWSFPTQRRHNYHYNNLMIDNLTNEISSLI